MNSVDFGKILQQGYYVTLGLTSIFLEIAQDPTKREARIQDFDRFTDELAARGVTTEAEARSYVDQVVARQVSKDTPASDATVSAVATTVAEDTAQQELQQLTQQIANLRSELEELKSPKS